MKKNCKKCFDCGEVKSLSAFYKHKGMTDGRLNKCIKCKKSKVKNYQDKNQEKIKKSDQKRNKLPHRVEARALYQKTPQGKLAHNRATKKWVSNNRQKRQAHNKVLTALRNGSLEKLGCAVCGTKESHAHHEDYNKPLEVEWLCSRHHQDKHTEEVKWKH